MMQPHLLCKTKANTLKRQQVIYSTTLQQCHRRCFGQNYHQNKIRPSIMTSDILYTFSRKFPNGRFLDASFGEGGHSIALIKSSARNSVIGLDCDDTISKRLASYLQHKYKETKRFQFVHSKWSAMYDNLQRKLPEISESHTSGIFDGILIETGSSLTHERIRHRALIFDTKTSNLDMRYFTTTPKKQTLAVRDLLKHKQLSVDMLADILTVFGDEERTLCNKIATEIVNSPDEIANMEHIVNLIGYVLEEAEHPEASRKAIWLFNRKKASLIRNSHPVKKILNALIAFINNSFIELSLALRQSEMLLKPNGVLMVICYNQLESRVIAEFLESRKLLNLQADNTHENAIVYVDVKNGQAMDCTFGVSQDTLYLKEKNERLGWSDHHGIGAARFNDFNAVPFVQPHIDEAGAHPKGKYARALLLQRTNVASKENVSDFVHDADTSAMHNAQIDILTRNNLTEVADARVRETQRLLSYPSHHCFLA